MLAFGGGNLDTLAAEVGPAVGSHHWISHTPDHVREPDESLRVLIDGQEAVALQNGDLHVDAGEKLANGGDLEEPVFAGLLGRVIHLVRGEVFWNSTERVVVAVGKGKRRREIPLSKMGVVVPGSLLAALRKIRS